MARTHGAQYAMELTPETAPRAPSFWRPQAPEGGLSAHVYANWRLPLDRPGFDFQEWIEDHAGRNTAGLLFEIVPGVVVPWIRHSRRGDEVSWARRALAYDHGTPAAVGRPPVGKAHLMLAAYLRDIKLWTPEKISLVFVQAGGNAARKATVEKWWRRGRTLLADAGAWPWMVEDTFPPRTRRWWEGELYVWVLQEWEHVTRRSTPAEDIRSAIVRSTGRTPVVFPAQFMSPAPADVDSTDVAS